MTLENLHIQYVWLIFRLNIHETFISLLLLISDFTFSNTINFLRAILLFWIYKFAQYLLYSKFGHSHLCVRASPFACSQIPWEDIQWHKHCVITLSFHCYQLDESTCSDNGLLCLLWFGFLGIITYVSCLYWMTFWSISWNDSNLAHSSHPQVVTVKKKLNLK